MSTSTDANRNKGQSSSDSNLNRNGGDDKLTENNTTSAEETEQQLCHREHFNEIINQILPELPRNSQMVLHQSVFSVTADPDATERDLKDNAEIVRHAVRQSLASGRTGVTMQKAVQLFIDAADDPKRQQELLDWDGSEK